MNIYKYVGVQPYTIYNGDLYLILGRESYQKNSDASEKWSAFGGAPDFEIIEDDIYSAFSEALREFDEESMGIFGYKEDNSKYILKEWYYQSNNCITFFINISIKNENEMNIISNVFNNIYKHFCQCTLKDENDRLRLPGICYEGFLEKTNLFFLNTKNDAYLDFLDLRKEYLNDIRSLIQEIKLFHFDSLY